MKPKHNEIQDAWRKMAAPPVPPAEDFWADFRARAKPAPQTTPSRRPMVAPGFRWVYAAAAAAAIVIAVFTATRHPRSPGDAGIRLASAPPSPPEPLSRIEEIQVFVDDASVMVFEDTENGGTVVFLDPPHATSTNEE